MTSVQACWVAYSVQKMLELSGIIYPYLPKRKWPPYRPAGWHIVYRRRHTVAGTFWKNLSSTHWHGFGYSWIRGIQGFLENKTFFITIHRIATFWKLLPPSAINCAVAIYLVNILSNVTSSLIYCKLLIVKILLQSLHVNYAMNVIILLII